MERAAMQRRKRIYWLTNKLSSQVTAIEQELKTEGYHCDFFSTLDALMSALAARRTAMIVVGDLGSLERDAAAVRYLAQRPELQGVRFVLANNHPRPPVMAMAAAFNFRDILPLDLPPAQWASRFAFATSTNPDTIPQTSAMIGMNQLASVHVPARVVWISGQQIWVESRLEAPPGTTLNLHGSLADAVGISSLKMEVVSTRNSYLFYRFSQASVCRWSVPEKFEQPVKYVLKDLRASGVGPSCRIFLALESSQLRNELIEALPAPTFKVSAALHKQGITIEPKYFSPDIVIVEDVVASEGGGAGFAGMMNNVESHVPVLVIGDKVDFASLRALYHHRPVFQMPQRIDIIRESIKHRFMGRSAMTHADMQSDAVFLPPEHPLSFAEISVPARLGRIHPLQGSVMTGLPVGRFALVKIEAPLLTKLYGRPLFAKLTSSYKDPRPDRALHPWVADFAFSDLDQEQRRQLSEALPQFVQEQMKAFTHTPGDQEFTGAAGESASKFISDAIAPAKVEGRSAAAETAAARNATSAGPAVAEGKAKTAELEKPDWRYHVQSILDLPATLRKRYRKDRRFRLAALTLLWVMVLFVALAGVISTSRESAPSAGKIWSDSFKAFRDRSNTPSNQSP
jgi:hypothetical protein